MRLIYFYFALILLLILSCTPAVKQPIVEKPIIEKPVVIKGISKPVEAIQTLRKGQPERSSKPYKPGTFLLKTEWNQGFPYNKRLPKLRRERVIAGCVNTALAQVLYYYKFPYSAKGIIRHYWNRRQLTANLYKNYNWDIIPASISEETPDYKIDELAALFLDLGIINSTAFNLAAKGGSGAGFNSKALVENLGFSKNIKTLENDHPDFIKTIKKEIDRRKVVLLSIAGKPSGHMAVIDGYRRGSDGLKFHINMGWGGKDNDFYDLTKTVSPKSKKEKNSLASDYTFSSKMTIYYNLVPCRRGDCYQNLEQGDQLRGMQIRGKFNSKKDKDVYTDLFLNGSTLFRGDRGYGNQAFYIKVYNDKNHLLVAESPKSKAFRVNLKPGKYSIGADLCKSNLNGEACYGNDSRYLKYKIDISSKPVPHTLKTKIQANDLPPEINGKFFDMILEKNFTKHHFRIEAVDPDGDLLKIKAYTEPDDSNILLTIKGNILSILPNKPISNTTSLITIQAISKGKIATQSFRILFSAASIAFGKEFDVGGKFRGQKSRNQHKVILQGNCVIQGDNGFKNQAFFLNVKNSEGKVRFKNPMDFTIRDQFSRDVYYLETALTSKKTVRSKSGLRTATRTYKYEKGTSDIYNINVTCPSFNDSITLLEEDNRDVAPKIISNLPDLILGVGFKPINIPVKTFDINGDLVSLSVQSNSKSVKTVIRGHHLSLIPYSPKLGTRLNTIVTASANGQQSKKSFTTFLYKEDIRFGKRFELKGKIKGQKDMQSHAVILSGRCQIKGDNGYKNQAFYTSVKRKNRSSYIRSTDKEIVHSFPKGIYYLTASLVSDVGRYYNYRQNKGDAYKIEVVCPDKSSTEDISQLLGIK